MENNGSILDYIIGISVIVAVSIYYRYFEK